ncbi:MFS general substrate transporter [Cutaneotrichosporon oleaginosum]|uniref:MFS general substrate transporter n=1 Tax=Cutaneotrichosporon oleaginosum TaxID=879819 RepID=A0A0J0XYD2_9TREE|nr:MFS general substrate transporter [Cutaneotrichosporon oleaginosum]KLT46062.1 MFS general substrate transporter [Cutaneotrichosporon oleaginosum]TXT06755.1 hypothetical protein COLE_06086 [Cutaneotrichosporon oleaginosum]
MTTLDIEKQRGEPLDDHDPPISVSEGSEPRAEKPFSAFSEHTKWFIITLAALGSICSPISTNIFVPAIPMLVNAFSVSPEKINLLITLFMVFQGITPAFWGAAADTYGRRPIYIPTLGIFVVSSIVTALCPTNAYWLLLLMRIVAASGASATIAVGSGVISDVARPQERGKYFGLFNVTMNVGPSLGPLLGGVLAGTLGWRSIFWFLTIMGCVILAPMILFMPETLRALVGDGSGTPPRLNRTPAQAIQHKKAKKAGETTKAVAYGRYNPLTSFLLLKEPDLLLMLLWGSVYYSLYYSVLTMFSTLLKEYYGFGEVMIGVCYISQGAGIAISSVWTGSIMDRLYLAEKARVGGDYRDCPEFRLERTRLMILPVHAALMISSSLALGWTMEKRVHVSVPIILTFVFGVGNGFLTTTKIYSVDLMPGKGGAVTASFNFTRCLIGAAYVGTVQIINREIGAGWMFVLLNGLCLLVTPLPLIVVRYGPRWRARRAAAAMERKAKLAAGRGDAEAIATSSEIKA